MFQRDDDGFSLVEVIIAMFLLAVLALAVLPLIVGASRLSVQNKDTVAATAFATSQLAIIRDAFPLAPTNPTSCAALLARETTTSTAVADPAGTGLTAVVDVTGTCPGAATGYPTSVGLTVTVRDAAGEVLVRLPTLVRVSSS